jgi:hypothetical protein
VDIVDIIFWSAVPILIVCQHLDQKIDFSYLHGRVVFEREARLVSWPISDCVDMKFQKADSFVFRRSHNMIQFATNISFLFWASAEITQGKQNTSGYLRGVVLATADKVQVAIRVSVFADLYIMTFFAYILSRSLRGIGPPYWSYIFIVTVVFIFVNRQIEMGTKQMLLVYEHIIREFGIVTKEK